MIVQNSFDQTDLTFEFSWKSPIPKRSNFDQVVLWLLVGICGSVSVGFGMIVLNGFANKGTGYCGVVETTCFERPLLTIQNVHETFHGNLVWEVKVENPVEGKSYRHVSFWLDNETCGWADFNNREMTIRIDDPAIVDYNRLHIRYETDEGKCGGPLSYELDFKASANALKNQPEDGSDR